MLAPRRAAPEHQLRAGHRGAAVGGRRGTEAPGPPRGAQPSRAARAGKCAELGEALSSFCATPRGCRAGEDIAAER